MSFRSLYHSLYASLFQSDFGRAGAASGQICPSLSPMVIMSYVLHSCSAHAHSAKPNLRCLQTQRQAPMGLGGNAIWDFEDRANPAWRWSLPCTPS